MSKFVIRSLLIAGAMSVIAVWQSASADTFPPTWNGLAACGDVGEACHFAPAGWPSEPADPADCDENCGGWQPYTRFQNGVADPRTQDPSNGGTRPQNYVNIASSCSDRVLPSIYYYLSEGAAPDGSDDVIMFRWRVEQIANTYATGPSPGRFSATDPWSSALWTVLFDTNGDGIRDIVAHLDGSFGSPSTAIDTISGIWGDIPTQSIDYINNPDIHLIAHNPTAFTDSGTDRIYNFQGSLTPTTNWPNGSSESDWDYGTSRARLVSRAACNEYFIDYQIPVAMLDASSLGGPKIERSTPISMLFCTANSLNNPFQKDCAIDRGWVADENKPGPFGDFISFEEDVFEQPIVDVITAQGCGIFDLEAKVKDTIAIVDGEAAATVQSVEFYYYHDVDGNGLPDDGGAWTSAGFSTLDTGTLNTWSRTWDATGLLNGQYLLGVQALDDPDQNLYDDGMTSDGIAHRTFSYLIQTDVDALSGQPVDEQWFGNPDATGVQTVAVAVNACGVPTPWVEKTVSATSVTVGGSVDFTITVHNTLSTVLSVSQVTDNLPAGFSFNANSGGSLTPSSSPSNGASGTLAWDFAPAASIPANSSADLIFTVTAPGTEGTYNNIAAASTSYSPDALVSDPVSVEVGAPSLTISKSASPLNAQPGDTVTYTISYSNDSPVSASGVTLTDVLPSGLDYVTSSASGGAGFDAGSETLSWNIGSLASGSATVTETFQATVTDPYSGTVPLVNTATIDSNETVPANASASIFIDTPRPNLILEKSASAALIDPGAAVTFTLSYANTGTGTANNVTLTDTVPAGFTFDSATASGTETAGVVSWTIGDLLAAGSGSVTVTMLADDPFEAINPAINQASIDSDQTNPLVATAEVGVTQVGSVCQTFYFNNDTGAVGFDGTQKLATDFPVPVIADAGFGESITVPGGAGVFAAETLTFYQDPDTQTDVEFSGNLDTTFFIDRVNGPGITIRGTVYDYDSVTGTRTQLGQNDTSFNGSSKGALAYSVALSGTLSKGHRLLWEFQVASNNSQSGDILFQYGGTVANSVSGDTPSTFANSNSEFCVTPPANLVLSKQVDALEVSAGDTSTYTINFANTGTTAAEGAVLTDTLPTGLSFDVGSALLNGALVVPVVSGQELTFSVESTDGAVANQVTGGESGVLSFTVTVDDPVLAGVMDFLNSASLESDQTLPVTDTATTQLTGVTPAGDPLLVVEKSASNTALRPGDLVTYTISVLNAGTAAADAITITDALPATGYFSYVASSISGGTSNDDSALPNLSWGISTLAPGASTTLSFQMQVAASGVPGGITTLNNQADATCTCTAPDTSSNIVTVSVTANPELQIVKSAETPPVDPGFWQPGDIFEYTLDITNTGEADALNVLVLDGIPADTAFASITQGSGSFEAGSNRVRFVLGTLASGASQTVGFTVEVLAPLSGEQVLIGNTASVSADNAGVKQASANALAEAHPDMRLSKTGPAIVPLPATLLSLDVSASANVSVEDTSQLGLGQRVRISGQTATIVALGSSTIELDTSITASAGDAVQIAARYALTYRNVGNATATNVTLVDTLPPGFDFHLAAPAADSVAGSVISWVLGDISPGQNGTITLEAFPTTQGIAINSATLSGDNLPSDVTDTATTQVGGLRVLKRTTTPISVAGGSAHYIIDIENTLPADVTGLTITDQFSSGFTLDTTTAPQFSGDFLRTATVDPADGEAFPSWGTFTILAGGTMTLSFDAAIADSVGPATYQNAVVLDSPDAGQEPFDPLATSAEDVTVLAPGTGMIEGFVYQDVNDNGVIDAGDLPLAGVPMELTDSTSTVYIKSTDSSGYFNRVVAAGNVDLNVGGAADSGIPSGLLIAVGSSDPASTNVPDGGVSRVDTGYVLSGSIGALNGHVFHDDNGNGVLDGGESGYEGVDVTVTDSSSNVQTVQTDASGNYSVTVPLGTTNISVATPAGQVLTTANASQTVSVPGGGSASADDVGFTSSAVPTGTVRGHVFLDVNGNGVQDTGEPNLVNVAVEIETSLSATLSTQTNLQGDFELPVPEGSTDFTVTGPGGYVLTTANDSQTLDVSAGSTTSGTDVGYRLSTATPAGQLQVLVFLDSNDNATRDVSEASFAGVWMQIDASDGVQLGIQTGSDGLVSVSLPSGNTDINVTTPTDYSLTTANESQSINVPVDGTGQGTDIGYWRGGLSVTSGELSGRVFEDLNNNGIDDGEPAISGATVAVTTADGHVMTMITDASGEYLLIIPAGTTRIDVTDPNGILLTTNNRSQTINVVSNTSTRAAAVGYNASHQPAMVPILDRTALMLLILGLLSIGVLRMRHG